MNSKTISISDGVILHLMPTDRFKTNNIIINIFTKLEREFITYNSLIPLVLRRGTINYPSMKDISEKLEDMYGASLDASTDKIGNHSIIQFSMDMISDEYTLDKTNLLEDGINLICEMVLMPSLENGTFKNEFVEQEKETLRELINSKINDKGSYAQERCTEEMYKDEPYGLYKYGYVEDLESIDSQKLYDRYNNLLKTAEIHIYISGKYEESNIISQFSNFFGKIDRNFDNNSLVTNSILNGTNSNKTKREVIEHQNVIQGKIVLGYELDNINLKEDFYKMTVYSAILGGTASSKLFNNVREKKSLAYTIHSQYFKHKGAMFVNAGIELSNYDLAKACILKEINDMKIGEFTEEEIHDAKVNLVTRFKSFNDSQAALIGWSIGQMLFDGDEDLNIVIDKINSVTKEEILEVASRLKLKMSYYLAS